MVHDEQFEGRLAAATNPLIEEASCGRRAKTICLRIVF
jgi:hypothetical protein